MQDHPKITSSQIWFFKPLDVLMSQYRNKDSSYFCQLFQRKKQIIDFMQQGKIDATKYLGIVKKMYKNQGPQKKYAELDLMDYTNINNNNVEDWFKDKVQETGIDYQDQQSFYNENNKSTKNIIKQQTQKQILNSNKKAENKSEASKVEVKQTTSNSNNYQGKVFQSPPFFVVGELISMKALDHYMQNFCEYKNVYIQLYEKKKKIVQWVQSKKINGVNYKGLIDKMNGSTQNLQLKSIIQTQLSMLNDLHDGNTQKWFQQLYRDSFFQFQMQTENYQKHLKGIPVKKIQKDIDLNMSGMSLQQQEEDNNVDPSQCYSFRILDQYMDKNQENPVLYVALYQKKIKLLDMVKKGQLNPIKYKALIKKGQTATQRNTIKISYEMELEDLNDIHQGNINEWFTQIMDSTKGNIMLQQDKYKDLKQEAKNIVKQKPKQQIKVSIQKSNQSKKQPKKQQSSKEQKKKMDVQINFDIDKMFSLKVLDDALLEYTQNDELFIKLFTQKQKIIDMAKNGEIDAKKYLKLQEKMVNQTFNDKQQIKSAIEMDIQNLQLIHQSNLEQWFNQIAQTSGFEYQTQLQRYNELMKISTSDTNIIIGPAQKIQKPALSQILCFSVINKAFSVFSNDPQFIQGLKEKCQKFVNWIKQEKLDAQKYQKMCKKIQDSTKNTWLKQSMKLQRQRLQTQFKSNQQKWFKQITKLLKNANRQSKSFSSIVSTAEQQINQASYKGKIRYYLTHLAGYESLCQYYKKNNIKPSKNQLIKIYLTVARKQIDQIIQKIKDQADFDVVGYCKKLLPQINQINFHQSLYLYQQKISQYIASLQTQISNYKEYAKKIKKSTNSNNLQNVKKKIGQCQQNIKYLSGLSKNPKKLIPIPDVAQEKVQWFNMDEIKLDPNQVEIGIIELTGFQSERIIKICFCGKQMKQFQVHPGKQKISAKIKISQSQMNDIMKGQKHYFSLNVFKKGWFSNSEVGTSILQLQFIRSNTCQGKCKINQIQIVYQGRVKMAKKPLVTEIVEFTLIKYPEYIHSKQVQEQFLKKYKI